MGAKWVHRGEWVGGKWKFLSLNYKVDSIYTKKWLNVFEPDD